MWAIFGVKQKRDQSGFSIISVMMAMGLASVMMFAVNSSIRYSMVGARSVASTSDFNDLRGALSLLASSREICTSVFLDNNGDPVRYAAGDASGAGFVRIREIQMGGQRLIRAGQVYNESLMIEDITFSDEIMALSSTSVGGTLYNRFLVMLRVVGSKYFGPGSQPGAQKVFEQRVIVYSDPASSNDIGFCTSQGAASGTGLQITHTGCNWTPEVTAARPFWATANCPVNTVLVGHRFLTSQNSQENMEIIVTRARISGRRPTHGSNMTVQAFCCIETIQ